MINIPRANEVTDNSVLRVKQAQQKHEYLTFSTLIKESLLFRPQSVVFCYENTGKLIQKIRWHQPPYGKGGEWNMERQPACETRLWPARTLVGMSRVGRRQKNETKMPLLLLWCIMNPRSSPLWCIYGDYSEIMLWLV